MKIAAILYEPGDAKAVDALFVRLASALKASGCKVAGAVQHNGVRNACSNMSLEDVSSGRLFDISVPGDKKRETCSLDPAALEDVAGQITASLDSKPDVLIVNRYGKQEVLGCGLRSVIEAAIANEVPVVTALCTAHASSWDAFTGGEFQRLPAEDASLLEWCTAALPERV